MAQTAQCIEHPDDRAGRLRRLGLSEPRVETIVTRGLAGRLACSPLHPSSYPGTTQWADTHLACREMLVPDGWTPCERNNYPRILSPDERVALTVATGDSQTGQPEGLEPATKYPKGPATEKIVETNVQLSMLPLDLVEAGELRPSEQQTWIFLLSTNESALFYELSLPKGQDGTGRVTSWEERIIFDPIQIDALPARDNRGEDDDDGDIDVPVERI